MFFSKKSFLGYGNVSMLFERRLTVEAFHARQPRFPLTEGGVDIESLPCWDCYKIQILLYAINACVWRYATAMQV